MEDFEFAVRVLSQEMLNMVTLAQDVLRVMGDNLTGYLLSPSLQTVIYWSLT